MCCRRSTLPMCITEELFGPKAVWLEAALHLFFFTVLWHSSSAIQHDSWSVFIAAILAQKMCQSLYLSNNKKWKFGLKLTKSKTHKLKEKLHEFWKDKWKQLNRSSAYDSNINVTIIKTTYDHWRVLATGVTDILRHIMLNSLPAGPKKNCVKTFQLTF